MNGNGTEAIGFTAMLVAPAKSTHTIQRASRIESRPHGSATSALPHPAPIPPGHSRLDFAPENARFSRHSSPFQPIRGGVDIGSGPPASPAQSCPIAPSRAKKMNKKTNEPSAPRPSTLDPWTAVAP
jgi:hypothetical protein